MCSFSDSETYQFSVTFGDTELRRGSFSLQLATTIQRGLKKGIQKGTESIIMTQRRNYSKSKCIENKKPQTNLYTLSGIRSIHSVKKIP